MEEKKEWKKKIPMWIKECLFEEVTDDRGTRILGYVNCSDKVLDFISQELGKARGEEYEKLVEIFDNLKYDPNGETDLVDKRFILGILKEELSKLTTK